MWRIKAAGESSLKGQPHKKPCEFLTSRRTRTIIPANATLALFIYILNLPPITFLVTKWAALREKRFTVLYSGLWFLY